MYHGTHSKFFFSVPLSTCQVETCQVSGNLHISGAIAIAKTFVKKIACIIINFLNVKPVEVRYGCSV